MTNFGATFRKARESKGIPLEQIAIETRISTRFLQAIENEEFAVLPGGIFNRGFIRTFAERVGLDPDQAVADYERLSTAHEPSDIASLTSAHPSNGDRHLYPIAVGILAVAIAIFYIVTRDSSTTTVISSAPPPLVSAPAPVVEQAPPTTTPQETTSAVSPVSIAEPEPLTPAASQALTLAIQVQERTWIKVTSDGNSVNPGEILEPGTTRKFTAENELYLSVGNAAGLTMKMNDMPLKPLGKSGQVRSVTFTRSNLKDFIG